MILFGLPPGEEGGGSPNSGRRSSRTAIPSRHPRIGRTTLPQKISSRAELRVIDFVAQHDPQPDSQFASRGDHCLFETLLYELSAVEQQSGSLRTRILGLLRYEQMFG